MSSHHKTLSRARDLLALAPMHEAIVIAIALSACGGTHETPDAAAACSLPMSEGDAGSLTALAAERCNVPGSMGASNWWRLLGTLPSGPMNIVQLELWPNLGAFTGGVVQTGTFTIAGNDASLATCGVCVRAVGDHGDADQTLYFATAGTVEVAAFGSAPSPLTATITNAMFVQVDSTGATIASGCTTSIDHVAVSGTVVDIGNTGSGGGGGGGGGGGTGACPRTVGDI